MSRTVSGTTLERLPYTDGSGRRRFVAGGILLIGIAFFNWPSVRAAVGEVNATDIIGIPVIAAGAVLVVYALGSIVEMLGEFFLIRAVSGVFWALGFPGRSMALRTSPLGKLSAGLLSAVAVFFLAVWNLLKGLLGRTNYAISLEPKLTPKARELYAKLPSKVVSGLSRPVGDDAEIALKHITELLPESDRKWARRLVNRAKDVSAITTALFLLAITAVGSGVVGPLSTGVQASLLPFEQKKESIRRQVSDFGQGGTMAQYALFISGGFRDSMRLLSLGAATGWHALFLAGLEEAETNLRETPYDGESTDDLKALDDLWKELNSLRTAADELVAIADQWHAERPRREALAAIQTVAYTAPFLFLYIGFFTSLRNAVVSIIETVAMQESAATPSAEA